MDNLARYIEKAVENNSAIGHFNAGDLAEFNAICEAAAESGAPVIVGVSEGERDFIGVRNIVAMVRDLRERGLPIFLNADHTHSFERAKEAILAGYDAILFDGGKLSTEENILTTKKIVEYAKSVNPEILVEGELGYIGSSSEIRSGVPEGAATGEDELTSPELAQIFTRGTGIDLLAPAVGNIHGMMKDATDLALNIKRIGEVSGAAGIPLVLHGASGNTDDEVRQAIGAGARIVHVSTELRLAWRRGLETALAADPDEIAPYKLFQEAVRVVKEVVLKKIAVFGSR